jgi:hypothetical protein
MFSLRQRERAPRRSALNTLDHTKPEPRIDDADDMMIPNSSSKKYELAEFGWGNFTHVQRSKCRSVNRRPNLLQTVREGHHSDTSSFICTCSLKPKKLPLTSANGLIANMDEFEVMMEMLKVECEARFNPGTS